MNVTVESPGLESNMQFLRIMVCSQFLNIHAGGAERYIREVCKRLVKDYEMDVAYLSSDIADTNILSPPCVHFMTTGFHPAWPKQTEAFLREFRPHVVYAHHTVPGLTDVLIRKAGKLGIPVLLMYHSDVTGSDLFKKSIGFMYHHMTGRGTFSRCQKIFVNSLAYASASPFLKKYKARCIEAPPGVDPCMMKGKRTAEKPYILFVGKPGIRSKGFHVLLKAWRQLRKKWVGLDLAIIGAVNAHDERWRQEGIRYHSYVDSRKTLADYYASAAVTVLPSSSVESFGMVLAEALLAGCPIVGSRLGGIPELIEDGLNGYLFSPGDVQGLMAALDSALRHQARLRDYISKKRRAYRERFSWRRTARIVAGNLYLVGMEHRGRTVIPGP